LRARPLALALIAFEDVVAAFRARPLALALIAFGDVVAAVRARPLALVLITLTVAANGCGGGGGGGGGKPQTATPPLRPAAPAFTATLRAPGHRPRANAPWPIVITATAPDGRPLAAQVRYQFLFAGRIVAQRSHYRFRGRFHDVVTWPKRSIGIPLTFRAVVTTALGTRNLDYPVVTQP
jgi:hypothetical protein